MTIWQRRCQHLGGQEHRAPHLRVRWCGTTSGHWLLFSLYIIILYYTIPSHYIVLLYIMYSQIFIFSLYCDKILGKKQLKAGRVCLAHSRGGTVHHSGRAWSQESGWSHCIHSREPEGTGSGAWLSDLKAYPLFTSSDQEPSHSGPPSGHQVF